MLINARIPRAQVGARQVGDTFGSHVKCAGTSHILDERHLEFTKAILFIKELLQPAIFDYISDGASDFIACLE